MTSNINSDLPPPWPNQALAQSREAHSIPMKDADLRMQSSNSIQQQVAPSESSGDQSTGRPEVQSVKQVDIKA